MNSVAANLFLSVSSICLSSVTQEPWWCSTESRPRWGWKNPWASPSCQLIKQSATLTNQRINHPANQSTKQPEDGEPSEESHGASNEAELSLQSQLSVSLDLIVAGRHKVDLDQVQRGEIFWRSWNGEKSKKRLQIFSDKHSLKSSEEELKTIFSA